MLINSKNGQMGRKNVTHTHTQRHIHTLPTCIWVSLVAQMVVNLPAMLETLVRFLGQEAPLEKGIGYPLHYFGASPGGSVEKEMATHSSILAWRSSGMEEPGGLPSIGSQRVGHD